MVSPLWGRSISFHSDASNICFSSDLELGDTLPPPHSTFVALRWLRFPPKLSPAKTEGFRQAVPRNPRLLNLIARLNETGQLVEPAIIVLTSPFPVR